MYPSCTGNLCDIVSLSLTYFWDNFFCVQRQSFVMAAADGLGKVSIVGRYSIFLNLDLEKLCSKILSLF